MRHPLQLEILLQRLSHVKGRRVSIWVESGTLGGAGTRLGTGGCRVEVSFNEMVPAPEMIFFDGECGLCHRAVRFILSHDRKRRFRFAPLQGRTFLSQVPEVVRSRLPDTLVVSPGDGRYLLRSDGVLYALERLGGPWKALAKVGAWLPRRIRDRLYDAIAVRRARLFSSPVQGCPVVEPELGRRFDP